MTVEYSEKDKIIKKYNSFLFRILSKEKTKYLLGRKSDCDIVINDPGFSREQTSIKFENGSWYVKDGGENSSRTGSW